MEHRPEHEASAPLVRAAAAGDEGRWRELWTGYLEFYEVELPDQVTDMTWQRMMDPRSGVVGRVALLDDHVVGFAVAVIHPTTWSVAGTCYLEDLFVDPVARRRGIGRSLIEDLLDVAQDRDCSRLYWHTQSTNPARGLYDEFVAADDFVRYRLLVQPAGPTSQGADRLQRDVKKQP
ncbi:GNAT family N-acetyltransferase [Nocardioides endophyticus]|uniref:GNAT family N-acetyltransferase n=1 Tax=Nocardioides endophyticus TaxID=1353775 RepID=UPI0031F02BD3